MFEYQKVNLIGMTQPIEKDLFSEDIISYCARVSNPQNQTKYDTSEKLLKYLIINKHWSPFEMVNVVLEIETTRDIARQILRHRSFAFQEFSQRYADPTQDLGFVQREARLQDIKNRQNSIQNENVKLNKDWLETQDYLIDVIKTNYNWAIQNGIAKEQARAILPEGLTISRMYMNGSLRSWITYIAMREKNGTQKEHKDIALKCKKIICDEFPSIKNTLGDVHNEWNI
jgi:thymidylate synthase (FAD)